ncbi:hypothetical protein H9P43_000073 [Blastocladiella emersonii ATCC 22665]|nr:hypothetical protein H9P43_000073 [Blastocladiella emersonii ATCC 22665]
MSTGPAGGPGSEASQVVVQAPMKGPSTAQDKLTPGAGVYGLYWFTTSVTEFWMGFSLFDMGEIGFFLGGIFVTLVSAAGVAGVRQLGTRSVARAMRATAKRLESDATLRQRIGPFRVGEFQAAAHVGGLQRGTGWRGLPVYKWSGPQRLQLLFALEGAADRAVVSADISRRLRGEYVYRSLVADVEKTGERLVYEGDERSTIMKGLLRLR